jgi:hypothetical protein
VKGFEGIVGHEPVLELLAAEAARPAHAYLFVGRAASARRRWRGALPPCCCAETMPRVGVESWRTSTPT